MRREIYAIHPGEHLLEELQERGASQADLARALMIPVSRVSEIVRGRRGITADTALRLGRWMGTGPEYWLRLQELYDLRVAEREHGAEIAKVKPWQDAAA